ncbi:MAG: alanine--tRNA ligase [Actinomycetes bacterium]|jgi:alanyl-tRNA synthetase|nr:alanine--tRNA ligase [Actinomycetes bacterium]
MTTDEIRESFLHFFEGKGCRRLPSSSLVPEDPSLLLTAAGMVQFKPIFLGAKKADFKRATTAQKCVRTTDIDIIGTTGRHLSFFEMLGNFSFGDYFKREAIRWSWEYSTEILGLDPDRIWVTVYTDDDEAEQLWLEETPVPPARIARFGEEDNFWAAGPTGPCGPCSELYYDQGESYGCGREDCTVGCECDRYVEYWNLVFMQYDRDEQGVLTPLPKQNIDTGLGLERMAAILQGVRSNFETDILRRLMDEAESISGVAYQGGDSSAPSDIALRILCDHARSVSFMIADGILPSNEGRGYVLRRLLRRAVRYGRLLGVQEPFMVRMTNTAIDLMSGHYAELAAHRELIEGIVAAEEERFSATLSRGLAWLDEALSGVEAEGELSGEAAFRLHDTYGFPIDLTLEIAAEQGYSVDRAGFAAAMEDQKQRARTSVKDVSWTSFGGVWTELANELEPTRFTGYDHDEDGAVIVAAIGEEGVRASRLDAGARGEIVLNRTPFYGEQGGQVGDRGRLLTPDGAVFVVEDTQIREKKLYAHVGYVESGTLAVQESVTATIDVMRRERTRRNHTATHLLHWALRMVVGSHVSQAGSFVSPQRLRFDFTHFEKLTAEQLTKVERLVNAKIAEHHPVRAYETTLSEARDSGVTALFGEKYGDYVRVLEIGNFSKELCGGTHIGRTTEIGLFKIVSEESVGANLRRIEALTSIDAYDWTLGLQHELEAAAALLKVAPRELKARVTSLQEANRELKTELQQAASGAVASGARSWADGALALDGYRVAIFSPTDTHVRDLRNLSDAVRAAGADAVVIVARDADTHKAMYVAAGNKVAIDAGFDAAAVVAKLATFLGGRGGGKPAMAQGGADEVEATRVAEALEFVKTELER